MNPFLLIYCRDNADLAADLAFKLSQAGLSFEHLTDEPREKPGGLAARIRNAAGPALMLVTDNFLKSAPCMSNMLDVVRDLYRQDRLQVVVADGKAPKEDGTGFQPVHTQFDKVVYAIQYLNFWQSQFLELSFQQSHSNPIDAEVYGERLNLVRDLSNQIGDLFALLRDGGFVSLEEFSANDFEAFFKRFNLLDRLPAYRAVAHLGADLPPMQPVQVHKPLATTPAVSGPLAPVKDPLPDTAVEQELPDIDETPRGWPYASDPEAEIRQTISDAWFWLENGHIERGLELFRLASEANPDHTELHRNYALAIEQFQGGTASPAPPPATEPTNPEPSPELHTYERMGDEAVDKGDYLFAKFCWDRVAEVAPQYPGIYKKLGMMTSEFLRDYRETAVHYLKLALRQEPENAELLLRLAQVLREQFQQPVQAAQHVEQALALHPQYAEAWLALAEIAQDQGDADSAADHYRKATGYNPFLRTDLRDAAFLPAPAEEEPAPPPPTNALPAAEPFIESPAEDNDQTEMPAFSPQPGAEPTPEPDAVPTAAEPEMPEPATLAEANGMPERVSDRPVLTVLITGASSGIGRATAELFAREGHRLILCARREERLEDLREKFSQAYHTDSLVLPFDVRHHAAVDHYLGHLPEGWQDVDVLINNAGLAKGLAPIQEGNIEHWETMIDTNIKGLLYVSRIVAPGMVARRKGHIINVGSAAGKEVYAKGAVYCATKFAVEALTRGLRLDLHPYGIRVSQVSPGHVEETEFALTRFDGDADKARIYDDFQPLRSSDVAEVIYFMATRPAHVNIQDVCLFSTQQASATVIDRSGRNKED